MGVANEGEASFRVLCKCSTCNEGEQGNIMSSVLSVAGRHGIAKHVVDSVDVEPT